MSTVIGDTLVLTTETYIESRRGGASLLRVWVGTEGACNDLVNTLRQDATVDDFSQSLNPQGGATVIAYFTVPENAETEKTYLWEFPPTILTRDLFQHPKALALSESDTQSVKYNVGLWQKNDLTTARLVLNGDARRLYSRIIRGGTQYQLGAHACKLTQVVPPTYSVQISDVGEMEVYTTELLKAEATATQAPFSGRHIFKLDFLEANKPDVGAYEYADDYLWGWLKYPSIERERADGKIEIQTHWIAQLWSKFEYDAYTPA